MSEVKRENYLLEVSNVLKNRNIITCFTGSFFNELVQGIGIAVKKIIESNIKETKTNKYKIFGVFIEQIQNIRNYCESKKESPHYERITNSAIISVEKRENYYHIISGNFVEKCDIENLLSKISMVDGLDYEELKVLYKNQSKIAMCETSGGGGLGFIDMARKSDKPIKYEFYPEDEDGSFFTIEVVLKGDISNE